MCGLKYTQTHLSSVGDGETVQRSDCKFNDFLPSQTLDHLRTPDVRIDAMSEPEIIAFTPEKESKNKYHFDQSLDTKRPSVQMRDPRFSPRPNLTRSTERNGELGSAFDLEDVKAVESFDVVRNVASFATSAAELSEVSVAP